jgi:hypothetical protein
MTLTKTIQLTEVVVRSTTQPLAMRTKILAPYLERLGIGVDTDGKPVELPAIIDADDYILELDDWERSVLRDHPAGTDAKGRPWPSLVSQGLAFQMRYIERAAFFDGAEVPASERAKMIGHLIIDGAIGITLLDDLQWAINRLIREGQVQVARRLTEFRNAVNQNVSRVRSYADAETFARSESAAAELSDGQIQEYWPEIPPETEGEGQPVSAARKPSPRPSRPKRPPKQVAKPLPPRPPVRDEDPNSSRLLSLTIVLVVSGLLWSFVSPRDASFEPPPTLTQQDFAKVPSIAEIEARPPSLYVTFSATEWREMGEMQRWRAVEQIGTIATEAGYLGAHMRTSDGKTVGQWLKRRGVKTINISGDRDPS